MTQYLISWDLISYYAECGANKLESTVSRLIDDTADPTFVCSNVPTLVTTIRARWDNVACHSDGGLLASCLSLQWYHSSVWCWCVYTSMFKEYENTSLHKKKIAFMLKVYNFYDMCMRKGNGFLEKHSLCLCQTQASKTGCDSWQSSSTVPASVWGWRWPHHIKHPCSIKVTKT